MTTEWPIGGEIVYSCAMPRFLVAVQVVGLAWLWGCAGLTCDQQKKESINRLNKGVDFFHVKAYPAAEQEFQAATTLDPENHVAAYELGQVFAAEKKWDRAIDAYAQAVKHNERNEMYHYYLGLAYYEGDKPEPAKKEFERALELNKRLFKAHWYLGRILARQDHPKEAAQEWTTACLLNPTFGRPFIDLGRLYYRWDFLDQAVQVLTQGAQYVRDAEDRTNIYYYLGMAYDAQKQFKKAADAYVSAIEARKENIEARLQAGMAYANLGDKEKANKYLSEFLKMGGGNNAFNIQAANDRLAKLAQQ
jgi:tetratricopeptide (TPR) repeat protein